jgi:predicted ABC-type ATPase
LHQARTAGYRTYFYFVCTESAMINHGRVQNRVASGGHDVPGEKIRERYVRSLALLEDAIKQSDRAYLFDNSEDMKLIAEFNQSRIVQRALKAPRWFMAAGLDK